MKPIVRTSLEVIRAQEEELKTKDAQLRLLGIALTEEKTKSIQKDAMIQTLGTELAKLKIDVALLKGVVNQ